MLNNLRKLLAQGRFQPLRAVMSSRREYGMRHPESATLTKDRLLVGSGVAYDGVSAEFDIRALLRVWP